MADAWVTLDESDKSSGFVRIIMAREPVNSMNLEFWQRLQELLYQCEQDAGIRGVIFASGLKRPVFTAGNDLKELYPKTTTRDRYRRFWKLSNTFLTSLYESPLLTISAINGQCPAGGCCISLCCDYRVMADGAKIGLNEVELGIPVPKYWAQLMARVVPAGIAEKLCMFAQMATAQQALAIGMVDEVVPMSQCVSAAEKAMGLMLKLPDAGRIVTKQSRSEFAAAWREQLDAESEMGFTQLQSPQTMTALAAVMERLSGNKARARL